MSEHEFPLCDKWAKEIMWPFRHRIFDREAYYKLEDDIYDALVEACRRGFRAARE